MNMKDTKIRINKRLVELSVCSRRAADELIKSGKVKINSKVALLGDLVGIRDEIYVNNKKINTNVEKVLYAYNKPKGIVCTESKKEKEKKVCDEIKKLGVKQRVFTIGRLDKDSTGLLLLTNDGNFAKDMTKYGNIHEKEYEVVVDKEIGQDFVHKMESGILIKELNKKTLPCTVKVKGKNKFLITICQGLNRQIRRMCDTLGYSVKSLKRIRIDKYKLGNMKIGEIKKITFALTIISMIFSNFNITISSQYIGSELIGKESGPGLSNIYEHPFNISGSQTINGNYPKIISTNSVIPKNDPRIITGSNGWYFLKNSEFLLDLASSEDVIEAYFSRLLTKLLVCRNMYVKDSKEFVFMICPEKNIIYQEYLPADERERVLETSKRIDQFVAYVRANSDIKVVYPKNDIAKFSKYCETYYRQDSHWNFLAGYMAAHDLIKAINPNENSIKPVWNYDLVADVRRVEGDLCYYNGEEVEYYLDGATNRPFNAEYIQVDQDNKKPIRIRSNDPKDSRKVFFIRDSFSNSMLPLLGEYFAEESFLYIINPEYFNDEFLTGDTFVIEIVERNFAVLEKTLDRLISKDYLG